MYPMNTNETSGAMLQALAEKYASVLGSTILGSREHDGAITFTLASGPKYTMTPDALQKAIEASGVTEAELVQALDASQGVETKSAPPAKTEVEETSQAQRKPRKK
jgi:hypothetical protein